MTPKIKPARGTLMLSAAIQTSCQNVSRAFDTVMTQGDCWNKAYRLTFYLFIFFALFFSEDSSQHYVSIQSSGGDNRLVEAND